MRTLSLSWLALQIWYDEDIVAELYNVLKSTPAITTLVLTDDFSLLIHPLLEPIVSDCVNPIWNYAKHLEELQLELLYPDPAVKSKAEVKEMMDFFVRNMLCSGGSWLDLQHPACPIQTITIVDHPRSWTVWEEGEAGNFTMSSIRKHADRPPKVVFQLSSDSARHIAAGVANEWGSNI